MQAGTVLSRRAFPRPGFTLALFFPLNLSVHNGRAPLRPRMIKYIKPHPLGGLCAIAREEVLMGSDQCDVR